MEKAILKTLIYSDIFKFPMKAWEIHKWLIGKKTDLRHLQNALNKLIKKGKLETHKDLYCLKGQEKLFRLRKSKEEVSRRHLQSIKYLTQIMKLIPGILLVGISGSLAMENSTPSDNINLFVIAKENRVWTAGMLVPLLLKLLGKHPKNGKKVANKICINLIPEKDDLEQDNKNIYIAHEVLQMRVLWQRDNTYKKYLEDNSWAFKLLPNWTTTENSKQFGKKSGKINPSRLLDFMESYLKARQLKFSSQPAVYSRDFQKEVLEKYKQGCKSLAFIREDSYNK